MDKAFNEAQTLSKTLQIEIQQQQLIDQISKASSIFQDTCRLQQSVDECIKGLKSLKNSFNTWFDHLQKKNDNKQEYYSIRNFNFRCRGFLLTFIHITNSTCERFEAMQKHRKWKLYTIQKPFLKRSFGYMIKNACGKFTLLSKMIEFCVIFSKDKENYTGTSPFSDSLDINDKRFQLDTLSAKEILEDIGPQVTKS